MFKRFSGLWNQFLSFINTRPTLSFFVLLALLFGTIALGQVLRTPEKEAALSETTPKKSAVFDLATETAFVTVPGKVRKETVVQIVALAPGIVTDILVSPGKSVSAGQSLFVLTNDYQSGSTTIQKQLAQEADRLNKEVSVINKQIQALEEKKIKRDDTLTNTEEDIELATLKRNRAERKSLLEQSTLSTQLTVLQDAIYRPKTLVEGTVQSITVRRGELVSAGKILATLSVPRGATTLETFLDPKTARLFDPTREAHLMVDRETLSLRPTYFSQSENENGLFPVLFTLSAATTEKIVNGEFLKISLPLKAEASSILLPIDAIFQDNRRAWVLKERDGRAEATEIVLGNLHGSYAEVLSGLNTDDKILLDRSVIAGEVVTLP